MYGYPNPGSPSYWERTMRRWLAQAGYYRCNICDTWKAGVGVSNKQCQPCHAKRVKARYYAAKAGTHTTRERETDWGSKANSYFEKQVALAPNYYGLQPPTSSSPLGGVI